MAEVASTTGIDTLVEIIPDSLPSFIYMPCSIMPCDVANIPIRLFFQEKLTHHWFIDFWLPAQDQVWKETGLMAFQEVF